MKKFTVFMGMLLFLAGCASATNEVANQEFTYIKNSKKQKSVKNIKSKKFTPIKKKVKNRAILRLDTKGHTSMVRDVIVTKDKKIITASDDKTIRVWNSKGEQIRKILGDIGEGGDGKIFAIALSSNQKYLVTGGYFLGSGSDGNRAGVIRIYNYKTGKLLKILKDHSNIINDLAFSSDSKFLISGSADTTAKIWSVEKNFALEDTIKFHTDSVYSVKIVKKSKEYYAITVSYDKQVAVYDIKNRRVVVSDKKNYQLADLATSTKHIAIAGYEKEIHIYDYYLNLVKTIYSKTEPSGMAYSADEEYLIVGTAAIPYNINIYKANMHYEKITTFTKQKNTTMAVGFFDKHTAISCGGENFEIDIWDIKSKKLKIKSEGVGETIWSVGVSGDTIAWGNRFDAKGDWHKNRSSFQKTFNLNSMKVGLSIPDKTSFKKLPTSNGSFTLNHKKGGKFGYNDAVLELKKGDQIIAEIMRDTTNGLEHMYYGFYKNYIISAGANGELAIYNLEGKKIAILIGHTGVIWSLAINGDRLVSGGDDQRVIIWNLSKLKPKSEKFKLVDSSFFDEAWKNYIAKTYPYIDINKKSDIKKLYENLLEDYGKGEANKLIVNSIFSLKPQLNIFVSKKNEWVAWTPNGFFNSSKDGAKYIGYHLNQGVSKEAKYITVDKLYNTFYRPDLIIKALNGEDLSKYSKDIDINKILSRGFAPTVKIMTSPKSTKQRDMEIDIKVCDLGGGYDNLTLLLNNTPVKITKQDRALRLKRKKINKECFALSQTISLQNGVNSIGFRATDKTGKMRSNTDSIKVNYEAKSIKKPNLHILTISIDNYKDNSLGLKYSNNDAKAISQKIKEISKSVFANVYTYSLKDSEVIKDTISKKFDQIGKKIDANDVFVLFIAGHGTMNDKDGNYYYIPYDFRRGDDVTTKAISQQNLMVSMAKIPATKSVILIDTCHSGSFDKNLQTTAIQRLTLTVGRAIISASSKNQIALEGYKNHGVFTYSLLDSLDNRDVYGFDNKLSISEIANYLKYILPKRTMQKWGYKQEPKSFLQGSDFMIGKK